LAPRRKPLPRSSAKCDAPALRAKDVASVRLR
jgi:hypothetical protein